MQLGLVVFANHSGLGNQTRRLAEMLNPYRLLAIDSSSFSKNKKQNWEWYSQFSGYRVQGFPSNQEIRKFLDGLTHVIVCENPLNPFLLTDCARLGIKCYIQSNYEFCDHLNNDWTLPTKFLMPSHWMIDAMAWRFGSDKVQYLPPPIHPNEFKSARTTNFARENGGRPRFLHIIGTLAANDRNGTLDLLKALPLCKSDFELVIHSQHDLPPEYMVDDSRVSYRFRSMSESSMLYDDFDAVILPRRYGGLSLTTNEALMSGLPVMMTHIMPNTMLLPDNWLVASKLTGSFMTRTSIKLYSAVPEYLAAKIAWLCEQDLAAMKIQAFDIAMREFSYSAVQSKYEDLL